MAYKLRTPDDVKRLFSALGDEMQHETLSIAMVDEMALSAAPGMEEGALSALALSVAVAIAAGWSAIQGYQRNAGSMPWGLTWAALGFLFPVPAVVYSAVKQPQL